MEDGLDLLHCRPLGLVQGLEVLHEGQVVLHLLQGAHAGEHHQHPREARGEADGIAGGAAAVEGIQHGPGLLGKVHQVPALHRLHDDDGLAVLPADLVAAAALDGGVLIVEIVELDLHHLHLRVVGEDLFQHLGGIVEGDAHVPGLALRLQLLGDLIGAAFLEVG